MESQVDAVIATNDDAATCKLACVQKGYYDDEFVHSFVRESLKRPPLINRGYWSRVQALRTVMQEFITSNPTKSKQIVNLGCGFDTSFFRLKKEKIKRDMKEGLRFFELDYSDVIDKKIALISKHETLKNLVSDNWNRDVRIDKDGLFSPSLNLMYIDLHSLENLEGQLKKAGIDTTLPTLFLSECVLIYLKSEYSDKIIEWASKTFSTACFCTYEQIHPDDPFGAVMVENLVKRGCPLLGITSYPTLESQKQRYLKLGWQSVEGYTMYDIYNLMLDKKEVMRIQRIELFDEYEEWKLIQEHYSLVWAFVDKNGTGCWNKPFFTNTSLKF